MSQEHETIAPSPDGPDYVCGNPKCRAVVLKDYRRGVYQYACESCGHSGVVPEYDYRKWLESRETHA